MKALKPFLSFLGTVLVIIVGVYCAADSFHKNRSYRENLRVKEQLERTLPLAIESRYGVERHLFAKNDYYIEFWVYHTGQSPVSGRYTLMASGDVRGIPKQVSPGDVNFVFHDVAEAPPGVASAVKARFYLSNGALNKSDLSEDAIDASVSVELNVTFAPANSEKRWVPSAYVFSHRDGKTVFQALPPETKK